MLKNKVKEQAKINILEASFSTEHWLIAIFVKVRGITEKHWLNMYYN